MQRNLFGFLLVVVNVIPLAVHAAPTKLSFIAPRAYPVNFPNCVIAGDFNGDGKEDFAVAGDNGVFVFLGTGAGEFTYKTTLATSQGVQVAATGDLNGDGIQDVVSVDFSATLSVFLGKGDGTFAAPMTYPMDGSIPDYVLIGDLNHDGRPDIVAAFGTGVSSGVTVYLGIGQGVFQKGAPNTVSRADIRGAALGDINGDGNLDLVGAGYPDGPGITIFLGKGDGTFLPGTLAPSGVQGQSMALADVNQDGLLDLIVGGVQLNGGVDILFGNGNGTFQDAVTYELGFDVGGLGVADFNGDGFLDIAAMNEDGSGAYLLYGAAGGTFVIGPTYPTPNSPRFPVVADFNGDGRPDLAIPGLNSSQVEILLNAGSKRFVTEPVLQSETQPGAVIVGDWNGDGIDDLAVTNSGSSDISVFLGKGRGKFGTPVNYPGVAPGDSIIAADFTGDGIVDLAVLSNSNIAIFPGGGKGAFAAPIITSTDVEANGGTMSAGDFNGDGKIDIAITSYNKGGVFIYLSTGKGQFGPPVEYDFSYPRSATVGDFNKDGIPDLVVSEYSGVQILLGVGDGTFTPGASYEWDPPFYDPQPYDTIAVDWNGDGNLDIITVDFLLESVDFLFGNGDGTFQPLVTYPISYRIGTLVVGDYNGDGMLDLAYSATESMVILPGNGTTEFRTPVLFTVGSPGSVANGHFLANSKTDIAIATSNGIGLLLNVTP